MAIYHFTCQHISRSSGRSVTAAAAYRAAAVIACERTGEVHDYTRKQGVLSSEILAPERAPDWAKSKESLWNMAEAKEKRKDSRVAREIILALPHELTLEQNKNWLHAFVDEVYVKGHKMVAQVDIHDAHREGDSRNIHSHILLTVRPCTRNGFADIKPRSWNDKETLIEWRKQFSDHMNRALDQAKFHERVDHRSYEEQGIDKMPSKHLGPIASSMERRKKGPTRIGDQNREAQAFNRSMRLMKRDLSGIDKQIAELKHGMKEAQQKSAEEKKHAALSPSPTDPAVIEKDRSWQRLKNRKQSELEAKLEQSYTRKETEAELQSAQSELQKQQGFLGGLTGKRDSLKDHVADLKANLANIAMRESEMRGTLNKELAEEFKLRFPEKLVEENLRPPVRQPERKSFDDKEKAPTGANESAQADDRDKSGQDLPEKAEEPSQALQGRDLNNVLRDDALDAPDPNQGDQRAEEPVPRVHPAGDDPLFPSLAPEFNETAFGFDDPETLDRDPIDRSYEVAGDDFLAGQYPDLSEQRDYDHDYERDEDSGYEL